MMQYLFFCSSFWWLKIFLEDLQGFNVAKSDMLFPFRKAFAKCRKVLLPRSIGHLKLSNIDDVKNIGDLIKLIQIIKLYLIMIYGRWQTGPNTGWFSHRWLLLGARKSAPKKWKGNFFPREVLFFKGSCILLHCCHRLSNLKSC